MKRLALILFALLSTATLFANGQRDVETEKELKPKYTLRTPDGVPVKFNESWSYVCNNHEAEYSPEYPVTDVCYFAADFNCYGELIDIPKRSKLEIAPEARCHMVVVCDSKSLTHFVISPEYGVRESAIAQIVKAVEPFDGLQLDFELIPARDGPYYMEFVKLLKQELYAAYGENQKMYTICVQARTKRLTDDIFPYAELSEIFDRIFVMAYDEHWSTSKPGAIASIEWCQNVVNYAAETVPSEKLIMGVPFYGRTWADKKTAGAWYYKGVNREMMENNVHTVSYDNDIPTFKYTTTVTVTGYFNDVYSVLQLCRLYESYGVQNIGFWRIGQENPEFWDWLLLN